MALRRIAMRRIGNRPNLFMGGDRKAVMFTGVISATLIFAAQEFYTAIAGLALWVIALFVFRQMAKSDPHLFSVLWRSYRRYRKFYPARATPFRQNTRTQGSQYR